MADDHLIHLGDLVYKKQQAFNLEIAGFIPADSHQSRVTMSKIKADISTVTWHTMYILTNANSDKGEFEISQEFINRCCRVFNELGELQDEMKAMLISAGKLQ